jgi:tRNA dimethylallyltransferase
MDIGTAKPSAEDMARVPHHLINIRDPLQAYSAAEFAADALPLIDAIRGRGRLPLLVGGTMLYFKALLEGLDRLPPADPAVRAELEMQAADIGWPAMHEALARIDPATAARLAPQDSQRIQRALEVHRISGQTMSSLHGHHAQTRVPRHLISLEPVQRAWLHGRIEQRMDAMLQQGFPDEVLALRARGDLSPELPSMRCVGYRQAWEALDRGLPPAAWREHAIHATRQLAKRQLTWLRSMPQREIVACDQGDVFAQVLHKVQQP